MATEAQLAIALMQLLTDGMAQRGFNVTVQQDNQPRQQGVPSGPAVFFHHVGTINVGWVGRKDVWNSGTSQFDHTETQNKESRYQIAALAPQNPGDPTAPTPSDFCNAASQVLQSSATIETLAAQNIGIQHVTDIPSIFFNDDMGRNEENPSFSVVFSHQQVSIVGLPKITNFIAAVDQI